MLVVSISLARPINRLGGAQCASLFYLLCGPISTFYRCTAEEAALHAPRVAVLNEKNEVVRYEGGDSAPPLRIVGE